MNRLSTKVALCLSFLNNGSGWFGGINRIIDGTYRPYFASADLDLDGDIDITVRSDGEVIVFLNDNEAPFERASTYSSVGRLSLISAGDIDLDGVSDLVVPTIPEEKADLYIAKGDGTFETAIQISIPTYLVDQVAIGDLPEDAHPEIVFATSNSNKIQILQVAFP